MDEQINYFLHKLIELEGDMKKRIELDAEQSALLANIYKKIEEIDKYNREHHNELDKKIDKIDKELHNGLIPKKAAQWFYSSVGKWIVGLLTANALAILYFIFNGR
jgi:hypothetical protein